MNMQHNEALRVRSTVKAGGWFNHNEALRVRSTVKAGGWFNHNEALRVRSTVKAGRLAANHNEGLRTTAPAIAMLRQPRTTSRKEDRLELLVIRAGLRAGRRSLSRR
jgi:hypothetical protein